MDQRAEEAASDQDKMIVRLIKYVFDQYRFNVPGEYEVVYTPPPPLDLYVEYEDPAEDKFTSFAKKKVIPQLVKKGEFSSHNTFMRIRLGRVYKEVTDNPWTSKFHPVLDDTSDPVQMNLLIPQITAILKKDLTICGDIESNPGPDPIRRRRNPQRKKKNQKNRNNNVRRRVRRPPGDNRILMNSIMPHLS